MKYTFLFIIEKCCIVFHLNKSENDFKNIFSYTLYFKYDIFELS